MNTSLAGRKIGKDLTNENFDNHDLRGADFSGVNVTGVRFCGALLGRAPATTFWLLLLQALLIAAASYFVILGNAFAAWFIEVQLKAFDIYSASNLIFILVIYAILFSYTAFISLRYTKWALPAFITMVLIVAGFTANEANHVAKTREGTTTNSVVVIKDGFATENQSRKLLLTAGSRVGAGPRAVDGPAALSGAILGAGLGTILVLVVVASIVAGSGQDTKIRSLFVIASLSGAGLAIQTYASTLADSIAQAGSSEPVAREIAEVITWAGAGAGCVFLLFGVYLGVRAVKREEPDLLFIRHWGIELNSLGATEFSDATLHDCDFSEVDLKHVRFRKVIFKGCNFKNAKNAHLALTRGTPLELRKVRDLVIKGKLPGNDRNFSGLNLHGLDFRYSSEGTLRNINFTKTDLSFANFSGCDLSAADLSEVNALGTRFSRCTLTGACIQHWNIDSRADLTDIDCDFVYTRLNPKRRGAEGEFTRNFPPQKNDRFDRNPPDGKFSRGDFSRIYKGLPGTLDFIVKSKVEMSALARAVESINAQAGGNNVTVQSVKFDRKEGEIVVRLEAPPEYDARQLYVEVKEKTARLLQVEEALKALQIEYTTRAGDTNDFFHELDNTIGSMGYSLRNTQDALLHGNSEKAREYLDQALTTHKSANEYIDVISKTLSRIEYSNINVRSLAGEVMRESMPLADRHKVQLKLTDHHEATVVVKSDGVYLKRVLINLVENGIKYAAPAGGEAAIVTIAITRDGRIVVVDVIDNGSGIPPDEQEPIWHDGYRGSNARLDVGGSGIGLAFVRKTMEKLQGHQIELQFSEPYRGTCFRLRLPQGVDESVIFHPENPLDRFYVLLVEKDPVVMRSWITLMEANGAAYDAVNSIEKLRVLLPSRPRYPDVVVTGYCLSDTGGTCTAVDVMLELESEYHHNIPMLIIADEATDVSPELRGQTLLRYPVDDQVLLEEITRLGGDHLTPD